MPQPEHRSGPLPLLLAAVLAAALWGCAPDYSDLPSLDTDVIEARMLADSSDSELMDRGRELFRKGGYEAAARRFGVLVGRGPENFEATARLGLALWFAGRADETAALWRDFHSDPAQEAFLRSRASGLLLLAQRLRARSILADYRRGDLLPQVPGTAVVLAVSAPDARPCPDAPPLALGLQWTLLHALERAGGLRPAPRELVSALLAESGAARDGAGTEEALRAARVLGAEYAVALAAWTPENAPGVLRTRLTVLAAEALPVRALRLDRGLRDAEGALARARSDLRTVTLRLDHCREVQAYFEDKARVGELLRERDQAAAEASGSNRDGDAEQALLAIRRYDRAQEEIAALQLKIREFERRAVPSMDDAGRFTPEAYASLGRRLAARAEKAEARLALCEERARAARERAATVWKDGREAVFDLPMAYVQRWPDLALRHLAALSGEPPADALGPGPGVEALAGLHRALRAWNDGEYDRSGEAFAQAGAEDAPAPPGPGFDVLHLADLPPEQLAPLLERILTGGPQGPGWAD